MLLILLSPTAKVCRHRFIACEWCNVLLRTMPFLGFFQVNSPGRMAPGARLFTVGLSVMSFRTYSLNKKFASQMLILP